MSTLRRFAESVVVMFDVGLDTAAIANVVGKPEAEIERELHRGLETRRQAKLFMSKHK